MRRWFRSTPSANGEATTFSALVKKITWLGWGPMIDYRRTGVSPLARGETAAVSRFPGSDVITDGAPEVLTAGVPKALD